MLLNPAYLSYFRSPPKKMYPCYLATGKSHISAAEKSFRPIGTDGPCQP